VQRTDNYFILIAYDKQFTFSYFMRKAFGEYLNYFHSLELDAVVQHCCNAVVADLSLGKTSSKY